MKNKQVYFTAASSIQKAKCYILEILVLFVIIYCIYNFWANPLVISIIVVFLTIVLFISGYNKVTVYSEYLEFKVQHPIDKFSKSWFFRFDDIKSIDADLKLTKKGFLLLEVLGTFAPTSGVWNTLHIELKNGKKKSLIRKCTRMI